MNRNATEVVMVWGALLAVAVLVCAPPSLVAQRITDDLLPLPETSRRVRQLETPPAESAGQHNQVYEVWRVGAPPEMMFGWYLRRLNHFSPVRDGALDTADVRMGELRPTMSYHITYHTFKDECADPGEATAAASDGTRPCKRWRLGKEKHRTLDNNRVSIEMGEWIERVTFTFLTREATGELLRRRIELFDAGLSDDWKRYTLVTQMTLVRDQLQPPTP